MSKRGIDRIMTQARDARLARQKLNSAQDAAAMKIAKLQTVLSEYHDRFSRDLHPTWPDIGSANLIAEYLESAVQHISSMPKGTSR